MSHWSRPILVALGVVLVPCPARAAEPTKVECIAANDAAQDLRRAGKLREAREKLVVVRLRRAARDRSARTARSG